MAKNVFAQSKEPVSQPKRNVFDLSFQNNLTMRFGALYPVFCKDVMPGDSFRIKPTFGLRFMPMTFPVQTRMQANLHFFYVRTRNLWKDFPDFIGRTKTGLTSPYLSPASISRVAKTGALGDYLNLPTTLVGDYGTSEHFTFANNLVHRFTALNQSYMSNYKIDSNVAVDSTVGDPKALTSKKNVSLSSLVSTFTGTSAQTGYFGVYVNSPIIRGVTKRITLRVNPTAGWDADTIVKNKFFILFARYNETSATYEFCARLGGLTASLNADLGNGYFDLNLNNGLLDYLHVEEDGENIGQHTPSLGGDNNVTLINETLSHYGSYKWECIIGCSVSTTDIANAVEGDDLYGKSLPFGNTRALYANDASTLLTIREVNFVLENTGYLDMSDVPSGSNLYLGSNTRISALPFRAYESIYNAFYRNQQNDPFTIGGVPEYNKFIPSQDGGEDDNSYALRFRNWEMDYLTSCVPSPQQGIAPLVGVSASGEFTFENEDGTTFTAQASVGDDGDSITGLRLQSGDGQYAAGTLQALNRDIVTNGISISDFRNVNALQRWLETNMRRGFRYKDQIMSHFGVDARFDELDMPEFIGGMSEPVLINQINQTVQGSGDSFEDQLGAYAGQASILASSNHSITRYCDEHGYIIGILSVSPVPNYSQILPKMFLKHDTLDYYFPEFGHIGLQPVTYREVCPVQSFADNNQNAKLDEVFGYQRAWYDLLGSIDEVHGQMRTSLRKFLINRQFDERPHLGHDFIAIDPEQVNDIFTVSEDTDKIVGQVYFDVQAKRPIPRFGIPRLEA